VGGSQLAQLPASERDTDPAVLAALGDIALSGGRLEESESLFRRAAQLAPGPAEYLMDLGIVMKQRGDLTEAARMLQSAIGADVSLQRAYLELSALYAKQGKTREAADVLNGYLRWNPQNILVRSTLDSLR
jgi:Flp pilus assembly protein TadD